MKPIVGDFSRMGVNFDLLERARRRFLAADRGVPPLGLREDFAEKGECKYLKTEEMGYRE